MKTREVGIKQNRNMKNSTIIDVKYSNNGPEDINAWLEWSKNIINKAKNGYYTEVSSFDKPDNSEVDYRTTFEIINKKGRKYKKTKYITKHFVKGATNKEDFLNLCKEYGLIISYPETFLRIYWHRRKKR